MNPWTILGWLAVAIISIPLAVILLGILIAICKAVSLVVKDHTKHLRTRNTPPAKGQTWRQNGGKYGGLLTISHIHDDGSISIRSGNASWGDSPEDWKTRVKNRKLVLISDPNKS